MGTSRIRHIRWESSDGYSGLMTNGKGRSHDGVTAG
jgi:hypothetical protein